MDTTYAILGLLSILIITLVIALIRSNGQRRQQTDALRQKTDELRALTTRKESEWKAKYASDHKKELMALLEERLALERKVEEERVAALNLRHSEGETLKVQLQQDYDREKAKLDQSLADRRRDVDTQIAEQKRLLAELKSSVAAAQNESNERHELIIQQQAEVFLQGLMDYNYRAEEQMDEIQELIEGKKNELADYQAKVDAMNQEILRRRELEEKQDFYRIMLTDEAKEDIALLHSIRTNLHNRTNLDKLVYDAYIAKAVKEMVKRVLGGADPSGIYKITNIDTNEAYVGKSVHIGTRWADHVKSACGLEGVADSMFQRALKKYGIDRFTFELLEKVDKANLSEREKYWITFYGTTKVGFNEKVG